MKTIRHCRCVLGSVACAALIFTGLRYVRADTVEEYKHPPRPIADLIDARPTPTVILSPTKEWMAIGERRPLPPIAELAQPELRLAGLRINPRTNGPSRESYFTDLKLLRIDGGQERAVEGIPAKPRIGNVRWSPDGKKVAFTSTAEKGIELWYLDVEKPAARRVTPRLLNGASGAPFQWVSDSNTFIARFVVERGEPPQIPMVPVGPAVQESTGRKAPSRTYQDLLQNAHDEANFDYYTTAQAAVVSLAGEIRPLGPAGTVNRAEPSPDGRFVLVETVHRPYSYLVPMSRFPRRIEVFDRTGKLVRQLSDLPLAEEIPIAMDAVRTGPRAVQWRDDAPATLAWFEAQDGGDPKREAAIRDRTFMLAAPFEGEAAESWTTELRAEGLIWGSDRLALLTEWRWKDRKTRTWIINPSQPAAAPTLLFERSFEDRYSDPGSPMLRDTPQGTSVLLTDEAGRLFLVSEGASPEGDRPFLDRFDLTTRQAQRLWRSEAPYYEYPTELLDVEKQVLITRRESVAEPPNYFLRRLSGPADPEPITRFPHPAPQMKDVYKEQIRYERGDGVKLTGTLYLPPGKRPEDGPFPMLMWAYPQEFKSADAAGQVTDSPYRFVFTPAGSPLLWLVHGFAVLDDPSLPIVGEGDAEPNDTYVKQLVAGAQAAVDEVVRRGVADRGRIGVGGHSYGAFMTANLLAHCDLFRAGIARSGAYNRTLTPFGFQAEERTFWQSPECYITMSPFTHADKINEPILLIHGAADNNPGTFTIQSERFYHALKGHGATSRLVLLPHESHGYQARESLLHMAWEMTRWLDTYVRDAKPLEAPSTETAGAAGKGS
jgi:dipeptidyl aminopeptidase/acylaminoacyl peptidase